MKQDAPRAELLGRIVAANRSALIAIADAIVHDRHEAEDVVQDTVVATLKRLPAIETEKLAHYLSRAVRLNALKRASRRREWTSPEATIEGEGGGFDVIGDIDPIDLEEAIQALPPSQRTVVRMRYYLGMTFRQIGISLSISTHTAASRCRYAISRMRRFINQ